MSIYEPVTHTHNHYTSAAINQHESGKSDLSLLANLLFRDLQEENCVVEEMFHTLLNQLTILATLHQRYDEVKQAEYEVLKPNDFSCTAHDPL